MSVNSPNKKLTTPAPILFEKSVVEYDKIILMNDPKEIVAIVNETVKGKNMVNTLIRKDRKFLKTIELEKIKDFQYALEKKKQSEIKKMNKRYDRILFKARIKSKNHVKTQLLKSVKKYSFVTFHRSFLKGIANTKLNLLEINAFSKITGEVGVLNLIVSYLISDVWVNFIKMKLNDVSFISKFGRYIQENDFSPSNNFGGFQPIDVVVNVNGDVSFENDLVILNNSDIDSVTSDSESDDDSEYEDEGSDSESEDENDMEYEVEEIDNLD